jgi:hypothetical protein
MVIHTSLLSTIVKGQCWTKLKMKNFFLILVFGDFIYSGLSDRPFLTAKTKKNEIFILGMEFIRLY